MTLRSPITFVTTAAATNISGFGVIIKGAYTPAQNNEFYSTTATGSMELITPNTTLTLPNTSSYGGGYSTITAGDFTPGDYSVGFVSSTQLTSFGVGSIITLTAGTYTYAGSIVPALPNFIATTIDLDFDVLSPKKVYATAPITMAVPEPSSTALLALVAGTGIAWARKRCRRARGSVRQRNQVV